MPLEKQVCSLEWAKKLRELGVKQDSYFHWFHYEHTGGRWELDHSNEKDTEGAEDLYLAAFTVAELGTHFSNVHPDVLQMAYNHVFHLDGSRFITPTGLQLLLQDPDLCAAMLVYLLENKLIELP